MATPTDLHGWIGKNIRTEVKHAMQEQAIDNRELATRTGIRPSVLTGMLNGTQRGTTQAWSACCSALSITVRMERPKVSVKPPTPEKQWPCTKCGAHVFCGHVACPRCGVMGCGLHDDTGRRVHIVCKCWSEPVKGQPGRVLIHMEECTIHGPLTSKDLPSAVDHPTRYEFEQYRVATNRRLDEFDRRLNREHQRVMGHTHFNQAQTTSPPTGEQ